MSTHWSLSTKYLVLVLILAAILGLIYFARPLIGPLMISALLAFLLNPLIAWISIRTRMPRGAAVMAVYLLFLALLIALALVFVPVLIRQILHLSSDLLAIERQIGGFFSQPFIIGSWSLSPPSEFIQNIDQFLLDFIRQASSGAFNLVGNVTSNVAWILVILVATYYFLKDSARLVAWIIGLAPPAYQSDAKHLLREVNRAWGAFLRGQLILALLVGLMTSILMATVGLRGAVGVGILAGVLDVIPSLGPLIAGIIAVLVALIFGSTYLPLSNVVFTLLIAVIFLVIQQIENIWLRPQIMGQTLRLHPGLIFIGVIGALVLTGILGALLVIPLMATIGILGKYLHARLLDENPWPEPPPALPLDQPETAPTYVLEEETQ
jgi:predicted PurR-regulated permease PerM